MALRPIKKTPTIIDFPSSFDDTLLEIKAVFLN
jgi:hypothetical protein